jgi:hypothetical protein
VVAPDVSDHSPSVSVLAPIYRWGLWDGSFRLLCVLKARAHPRLRAVGPLCARQQLWSRRVRSCGALGRESCSLTARAGVASEVVQKQLNELEATLTGFEVCLSAGLSFYALPLCLSLPLPVSLCLCLSRSRPFDSLPVRLLMLWEPAGTCADDVRCVARHGALVWSK